MNSVSVVRFAGLFFAGILSGVEIALHYGLQGPTTVLSDRSQIQLRQALVRRLRVLVPALFLPTAVLGVVVMVIDGAAYGLWLRCVGVFGVVTWIAIRVIGTVPINSASVTWDLDAPPENWRALIDHAERFHIVGVWAVVLAFACFLANAALTIAAH